MMLPGIHWYANDCTTNDWGTKQLDMLTDDPHDDLKRLYMELRALTWTFAKQSRQALEHRLQAEGVEMSWLQHGVLRVLYHEGDNTISELSKIFKCDPSTLVPAVDALERKGFLQRTRDPQDRRRVILSVTAAARAFSERMDAVHDDDPILNSLRIMGRNSGEALVDLMRQLIRGMPDGEATIQHLQERIRINAAGVRTSETTSEPEGE
jgi:DNA-binding MarR family transcriptional regulator